MKPAQFDNQEPVAWIMDGELFFTHEYQPIAEPNDGAKPLYTASPSKQAPFGYVYKINGTYTDFSKELPPDDGYDNGTLVPVFTAPPSKPDDLLRQSEQEGWRWAKECEAEVKRLRTLLAEEGKGCSECGVTVSEGCALYCVKCVEPLFAKEWVSLTDEEIDNSYMFWVVDQQDVIGFGKSLETKIKRKNT